VHARAGSAGHLSAAATATSDLDITVLTHDSGRHPAHQTGATAGRRADRRSRLGSARGCARSIASTGAAGSTTSAYAATATACAGSTWTRPG
jgi:hypothetical protein